jgi:hypothetical protein
MNYIASRRHKRSYSINRFEDLDLHLNDETTEKTETSTKTTQISEAPFQNPSMSEFNNVIQNIQTKITSEFVDRSEKNKEIRSKILKELYRNASTQAGKEVKKSSQLLEKPSKKSSTGKPGSKPLKPKLKRVPSALSNLKENIPLKKLTGKRPLSRNQRNKSNDMM